MTFDPSKARSVREFPVILNFPVIFPVLREIASVHGGYGGDIPGRTYDPAEPERRLA
jgi:hypothetical protein